jgi:RimJ/RimL family protein N-acetyltransferase
MILEKIELKHFDDLFEITSNINIMKYVGNGKSWNMRKTINFINYGNSLDYFYKGIILKNKLIGVIGIYRNEKEYYNFVIFLHKDYQSKGYAKQALFIFKHMVPKVNKIYADVLSSNIKSINFFSNLGVGIKINSLTYRFDITKLFIS